MDWTGGTRRRFTSAKSNAQIRKQKAHFAKMRAANFAYGLSNGFEPHCLRDIQLNQARYHEAPLQKGGKECAASPRNVVRLSMRSASWSSMRRVSRQQTAVLKTAQDVQHLRASSSHSRSASARRPSEGDSVRSRFDENISLERRRRWLLDRSDWLGLQLSRPIQMQFPLSRDADGIGKRRRVHKRGSPKGTTTRRATTPLFQKRPSSSRYMIHGPLQGGSQIHVQIGSVASSQSHYKPPIASRSLCGMSSGSEPLSEESMLLDPDEDLQFLNVPNWRPNGEHSLPQASNIELQMEFTSSPATLLQQKALQRPQTVLSDRTTTTAAMYSNSDHTRFNGDASHLTTEPVAQASTNEIVSHIQDSMYDIEGCPNCQWSTEVKQALQTIWNTDQSDRGCMVTGYQDLKQAHHLVSNRKQLSDPAKSNLRGSDSELTRRVLRSAQNGSINGNTFQQNPAHYTSVSKDAKSSIENSLWTDFILGDEASERSSE